MLHLICQQIWKTQKWPEDRKKIFIPIPKKDNGKECSNYHTISLISHASKEMLKIFQARLQQYRKHKLPGVQTGFRKGRGTRVQIPNTYQIIEKAIELQEKKKSTSASLTLLNSFTVIHTVKGFGIVNKAEIDVFSGTLLLFL